MLSGHSSYGIISIVTLFLVGGILLLLGRKNYGEPLRSKMREDSTPKANL